MKHISLHRILALLLCLLCMSAAAEAHTINYDLAKMSQEAVAWSYLKLGFLHILPLGLDHILFVVGLFLLSTKLRPILTQITAFTLAHTLTLGLGTAGLVNLPTAIVEPLPL